MLGAKPGSTPRSACAPKHGPPLHPYPHQDCFLDTGCQYVTLAGFKSRILLPECQDRCCHLVTRQILSSQCLKGFMGSFLPQAKVSEGGWAACLPNLMSPASTYLRLRGLELGPQGPHGASQPPVILASGPLLPSAGFHWALHTHIGTHTCKQSHI